MEISPFEAYGLLVDDCSEPTQLAGRYLCQKEEERNIPAELCIKLKLNAEDNCLEIGCGPGSLLLPLAKSVKTITGIDHSKVILALKQRVKANNIHLIAADFLHMDTSEIASFDKIIMYSVLHCFRDIQTVHQAVNRALALLRPGGAMILGDLPNADKKDRFSRSKKGKAFAEYWQQKRNSVHEPEITDFQRNIEIHDVVSFNDESIMTLLDYCRSRDCESYLVPQGDNLPFCHTREDIIVHKHG